MRLIKHNSGGYVIDDSYNNNPEAAKASLQTLKDIAGNKKMIVVFGDMLELGRNENNYHRSLGKFMGDMKVDHLVGVGQLSKLTVEEAAKKIGLQKVGWVSKQSEVDNVLKKILKKNVVILIKGSRSMGLDKLIVRLFK